MTTYGNSDFDMFAVQVPGYLFQKMSSAYVEVSAADSEASAMNYPCMPQAMITGQRVSHQGHHQPLCRRRVSFCSASTLSEDLREDSTLNDACCRRRVSFLSSSTLSEDLDEDASLFCDKGACCRPEWCSRHWRSRYEKLAAHRVAMMF